MKRHFISFLIFTLIASCVIQAQTSYLNSAPRLIVRGDDMGSFHAANVASIDTYKNGIETSIELMVVTSWFPEAVKMLRETPGVEVGLHLTITSEWDGVKWRPLTHCPSLTDNNGYFYPMMSSNKDYP